MRLKRRLKLTLKGVHVSETETVVPAALDPLDAYVNEALDQDSEQSTVVEQAESAPVEVKEETEAPTEADKPKGDGFQKRIDKVTADKYAEQRRADELQKWKDDILAKQAAEKAVKPKLEDFDYDEEKLEKATRQHEIDQGVQTALAADRAEAKAQKQQQESEQVLSTFNERVDALGKADFDTKANAIPVLPKGVVDALMQSEQGAEIVYHLGSNLDVAESLANMSPAMAMMEIGKLSTRLSAKPEIKPSAAPEPIVPVKAGSVLTSDIGDDMSMDEWMRKHG